MSETVAAPVEETAAAPPPAAVEPAAPPPEDKASTDETTSKTLLSADEGNAADGELSWQPPEGMELNESQQAMLSEFTDFAKEHKLSPEQYKALIDYDVQRSQDGLQQVASAFTQRIDSWGEATRADGELGGANIQENLGVAKTAMDQIVTPELGKLLSYPTAENPQGMGLGNHPEVIRLFYRIGKALGEDKLHLGSEAANDGDLLRKMYPTMYPDA